MASNGLLSLGQKCSFWAIFSYKSAYFTLHPYNLHVWAHADLTGYDQTNFEYLQLYDWFLFDRSAGCFWTLGWILAICGNSFFAGINTLNLGVRSTKFGLFVWTKSIFSFLQQGQEGTSSVWV